MPDELPPVNIGNVSGAVRDYLTQGWSARASLADFRTNGGAIRDSRWYALFGQVRDTIAREPEFLALNPYVVPSPDQYGTWAMGQGGQYATQVRIQLLDRATGLLVDQLATYVSGEPHAPIEAEQWARDTFGENDLQTAYGVTVMGATATKIWQTVPYGSQ